VAVCKRRCGSATPGAADAADAAERTFAMAGSRSAVLISGISPFLWSTKRPPPEGAIVLVLRGHRHASHRLASQRGPKPYNPFAFVYAGAELPFCSQMSITTTLSDRIVDPSGMEDTEELGSRKGERSRD
jgi:hypothetical protein